MRDGPAIGIAVFATPLVPGTVLALASAGDPNTRWAAVPVIVIGYPISLVLTAIGGLPLFLVLRRLEWLRWWTALLAGMPFCPSAFSYRPLFAHARTDPEAGWD
jgi:hypothetical protein